METLRRTRVSHGRHLTTETKIMRSTITPALIFASTLVLPSLRTVDAQTRTREPAEVRIERLPGGMSVVMGSSNRAMLGVTLTAERQGAGEGVRMDEVVADGPAAKAGIKVGDVITEVSGVSLKLSTVDADDPELAGIGQRRLQRALAKAKPGDDVELRVQTGGSSRLVKVKTVSAADLEGAAGHRVGQSGTWSGSASWAGSDRPALGLSLGASGSARDTLGLFVSSVVAKGPAEIAGIVEGDRIAAINDVDVRVPKEDVEDMSGAEARVNRFVREVQKGEAGAALKLRVYGGGRYREVTVQSVKSSALPSRGFDVFVGDRIGGLRMTAPSPELLRFEGGNGRVRIDREAVEELIERVRSATPSVTVRRRVVRAY